MIPFCTSSSLGLGESEELLAQMAGSGNRIEGQKISIWCIYYRYSRMD